MTNYRYLGYGVTNNNGVATLDHDANGDTLSHSYTGVGAGEVDIVASLDNPVASGSLVSETYSLMDCLFYQDGTTEPPSNTWIINGFTPSYSDNGTTLTSTTFATCFANLPGSGVNAFDWDSPVAIEFEVVSFTSTDVDFQIYDNTNNVAKSFSALSISNGSHLKILVESNQIRYFIDGTEKTGAKWTGSIGTFRVGLRATGTITFKDFMIYPI